MAMPAGMSGLKAHWLGWSARFATLQQREKLLVAGAAVFAILFGGYTFWIEPALLQKSRLQKTIVQQQAEQGQVQAQLHALVTQGGDPDAPNRAVLARLQQELAVADRDIQGFDSALVSPTQAPALLQTLLMRHRGLSLVSLTTLPPQPLVAPAPGRKEDGKPAAEAIPEAAAGNNIYRHGIEIKVAGSYHDLMAYVAELESGPQRLLWGGMQLAVRQYPVSELTLTVFTLSLDPAWLKV
jgi:MSHA biogenesis protein MshJ